MSATQTGNTPQKKDWRRNTLLVIHLGALVASIILLSYITYDSLINVSFMADPGYLKLELKVCLYFIFDVLMSWILSTSKNKNIAGHIMFLLVCIPWLNVINKLQWHVAGEIQYLLRFLPMIRAAYVVALIAGFISSNKIANLFRTYIVLIVTSVYFGSLMFYVAEHFVNPEVASYWDAMWWTVMDMTTAGCEIEPYTETGKALSVVLSAEGIVLFPVFTVYFTSALSGSRSNKSNPETEQQSN